MTFTAPMADMPEKMSLKCRLAWEYFFGSGCGGWAVAKAGDTFIVTDESCDLATAAIHPDEDTFVEWLEETASAYLEDDPVSFLRCFVFVPELVDEDVAKKMMEAME